MIASGLMMAGCAALDSMFMIESFWLYIPSLIILTAAIIAKFPAYPLITLNILFFILTNTLAIFFLNIDQFHLPELDKTSSDYYTFKENILAHTIFIIASCIMIWVATHDRKQEQIQTKKHTAYWAILFIFTAIELYVLISTYITYGSSLEHGVDRFTYKNWILPIHIQKLHNLTYYTMAYFITQAIHGKKTSLIFILIFATSTLGMGEKFGVFFNLLSLGIIIWIFTKKATHDKRKMISIYTMSSFIFIALTVAAVSINKYYFKELDKTYIIDRLIQQGQIWHETRAVFPRTTIQETYDPELYPFARMYDLMEIITPSRLMNEITGNLRVYNGSTQASLLYEGGPAWLYLYHLFFAMYFSLAIYFLKHGSDTRNILTLAIGTRMLFNLSLAYQLSQYDRIISIETAAYIIALITLISLRNRNITNSPWRTE